MLVNISTAIRKKQQKQKQNKMSCPRAVNTLTLLCCKMSLRLAADHSVGDSQTKLKWSQVKQ